MKCAYKVDCVWKVMAHAQKPDLVFRRNGRVHLNRRGRHFSRLQAAEVCASAVVMLDAPCSEVVWRVLAKHSIRQFPLHFPSCASPCAITFQLESNTEVRSDLCILGSSELAIQFNPSRSKFLLLFTSLHTLWEQIMALLLLLLLLLLLRSLVIFLLITYYWYVYCF
jgi:hypothetical protein